MVSNEYLESELEGLANTPTATDLAYEDSTLYPVLDAQNGCVEIKPESSPDSAEAWLQIDIDTFVFTTEEWC